VSPLVNQDNRTGCYSANHGHHHVDTRERAIYLTDLAGRLSGVFRMQSGWVGIANKSY